MYLTFPGGSFQAGMYFSNISGLLYLWVKGFEDRHGCNNFRFCQRQSCHDYAGLAVLKTIAKATPWAVDDEIVQILTGFFGRGKVEVLPEKEN